MVLILYQGPFSNIYKASFNCKYVLRITHTSLEIFRNLDVDNWHWGLLPLFPSGHRISFTLHQLHHQQKEARTGYCLDWTFSNNLWSDYKGKISNFPHNDALLINIAWRNWTVSLLFGPQGTMVYVCCWLGDAICFFCVHRREVSECMCGLSFVFSVPVKNCAVCGRLGCNRWALFY